MIPAGTEIVDRLGEGPVFRLFAAQVPGGDLFAIRRPFLHLDGPGLADAFGEAIARVPSVSGIERIESAGQDGEGSYIIGTLTRGETVAGRIRKLAPLTTQVAVGHAAAIARALVPLHRAGVPHGDLRPDNMVFLPDGEVRLQLAGLWRAYGTSPALATAWYGAVRHYLPPELIDGGEPSLAGDVWAVGAVLHELLTGRIPEGATPSLANVPASVRELLDAMRETDVSQRIPDASTLLLRLREVQDALRFGRPVTTRVERLATAAEPAAPTAKRQPASETPPPPPQEREEEPRGRDVPAFMLGCLGLMTLVVAILIGVYAYFNFSRPELVTLPNLRGLSEEVAGRRLSELGLRLRVGLRRPDAKMARGKIMELSPAEGMRMPKGSTISVVVSEGPSQIPVPDLKGLTTDRAVSLLSDAGLSAALLPDQIPSTTVEVGKVAAQDPPPGALAARGGVIKLSVSSGAVKEDTLPQFTASIVVRVRDAEESVQVRVEVEDASGTRSIHDERHEPGDRIPLATRVRGPKATFRVYYDDALVTTVEKEFQP